MWWILVGTGGGSGSQFFNVSTASAFVVASCLAGKVAKATWSALSPQSQAGADCVGARGHIYLGS